MRVLLAGASGAIGRYLLPQLVAANHEVIGITRTPGSLAGTGAREVVADVLDRPALLAALDGIRADVVIHQLTALSKAPARARGMRETNRLRVEGTSTLIAAARRIGAKKFVAASFFGGYGLTDHGRSPLLESDPFGEPDGRADAVQMALLSLEQQVHAFGGVSLRFGLFYDGTTSQVSPVSATWNGVLPMLHVSDAAAATVRVLARYKAGAIYNIADDEPLTYRAREIARAAAAGIRPPARLPDAVLRIAAPFGALLLSRTSMALDTAKANSELGWTPQYPSLLTCLGVAAAAPTEIVVPRAAPKSVVEAEPVLDSEPEPEPEPEPELEREPEPVVVLEVPKPAPKLTQKPKPIARPKAPAAPKKPIDIFKDMEDAIARIGVPHDD
ncbi:MAG TPA: NAD(P)-dependent oxidoreductase [Galbitalea sp.]|jgi:nucleoside-diphosphate-sugar epimerase|nr:NAD(P)-dependent oxidoreductase [Galbitalea sp.]